MQKVFHALMLNLHQPAGNLEHLLANHEWEAKEILWALDRMPRALWEYEDVARVHLSLSGTLLETLANPAFQERVFGFVKCGDLLWHLQNRKIFSVLGTGFYHPVLASHPTGGSRGPSGAGWASPNTFSGGPISKVSGRRKWASAWS